MKILTFILIPLFFITLTTTVRAEEVCVQNYGQPVVCGTKNPEYHVPVQAGLGDLDIRVIGAGCLALAGVFYVYSNKKASSVR